MSIDAYYLFASSIAALVARTLTYPIDTIKTRLQVEHPLLNAEPLNETILNQASRSLYLLTHSSLSSLYQGLLVTILLSVPALSVYLSCYAIAKTWLDTNGPDWLSQEGFLNPLVSGCFAEVVSGIFFTPMEVLKSCLQNEYQDHNQPTSSTFDLVLYVWQTKGLEGFYRGYWMSLLVFVPHTMTYFLVYEKLKAVAGQESFVVYLVCSTLAGTAATVVSTPLDIIKTRWQVSVSEDENLDSRKGPLGIAHHMWQKEGKWRGFTRGLFARIATMIPMTTISMTVFESLMNWHSRPVGQ
ncbi:mitochondrial carrier domain-containing protein [Phycomyces nitens]|nr:mitochondrial carrier domain-containing protein [Phycomyces nitens]